MVVADARSAAAGGYTRTEEQPVDLGGRAAVEVSHLQR